MPRYTKAAYEEVAAVLNAEHERATPAHRKTVNRVTYALAALFEKDNPNFDATKFITASRKAQP